MSSSPQVERGTRVFAPRTWSLRVRLLVTQVVLLAVACAGIGIATALALQRFLIRQLDTQLLDTGRRSVAIFTMPAPPMRPPPPPGFEPGPPPPGIPSPPDFPPDFPFRERFDPEAGPGPGFLNAPCQPTRTVGAVLRPDGTVDAGVITREGGRAEVSVAAPAQRDAVEAHRRPAAVRADHL